MTRYDAMNQKSAAGFSHQREVAVEADILP